MIRFALVASALCFLQAKDENIQPAPELAEPPIIFEIEVDPQTGILGRRGGPPQPGEENAPDVANEPPKFDTGVVPKDVEETELSQEQWDMIMQIIQLVLALFGGGLGLGGIQVLLKKRAQARLKSGAFQGIVKQFKDVQAQADAAEKSRQELVETLKGLIDDA